MSPKISVDRVNLNGRNFRFEMDGVVGIWGFYVLRDVAADDRPTLEVEEITEINAPDPVQPGYIFYPEKPGGGECIGKGTRLCV